jgi:phytoene dehydrogenase-like protein
MEPYLPGISSNIEVMEVATPRTNERFTLNPKGSLFGWANTVDQSMWNRLPQKTPIKNLYLAGAWTLPCGGQSVVLMSGYMAANMILDED